MANTNEDRIKELEEELKIKELEEKLDKQKDNPQKVDRSSWVTNKEFVWFIVIVFCIIVFLLSDS